MNHSDIRKLKAGPRPKRLPVENDRLEGSELNIPDGWREGADSGWMQAHQSAVGEASQIHSRGLAGPGLMTCLVKHQTTRH